MFPGVLDAGSAFALHLNAGFVLENKEEKSRGNYPKPMLKPQRLIKTANFVIAVVH